MINVREVGTGETFGSLSAFLHKTFSKFKQVKTDQIKITVLNIHYNDAFVIKQHSVVERIADLTKASPRLMIVSYVGKSYRDCA